MHALTSILALIAVVAFAVACGDDGGGAADAALIDAPPGATFDLALELNGYGMAHDGDTLFFALWDDADTSAAVATTTLAIMSGGGGGGGGGGNNIALTDVLVEGHSYTLYWYADINDNMTCDMTTDHSWNLAVANVAADANLTHQHVALFDGDCTKH